MAFYTCSIAGATASTSNDTRALVTTATGAGSVIAVHHLFLAGEAGSSTVVRFGLNRPGTAGITPGSAQTPEKMNPASVAAAFSVPTTWGTQPVLSTNDVLQPTFNAFGGVYKFDAIPGMELIVGTQGAIANLSLRSRSGTPTFSGHFIVEEK